MSIVKAGLTLLDGMGSLWESSDVATRKRLQRFVFPEGTSFDGKGFGTSVLPACLQLGSGVGSSKGRLVPGVGIEPTQCCHRGILSPVRLPVPPSRQGCLDIKMEAAPGFGPGYEGFADPCLTTWLCRLWSGRRDLNPRHSAWEADALPLSYSRTIIYTRILHSVKASVNPDEGAVSLLQPDVKKQSLRRVYVCRSDGNSGADRAVSAQVRATLRFRDC